MIGCAAPDGLLGQERPGWQLAVFGTRASLSVVSTSQSCYIFGRFLRLGRFGRFGLLGRVTTYLSNITNLPLNFLTDVRGGMGLNQAGKSRRVRTPLASQCVPQPGNWKLSNCIYCTTTTTVTAPQFPKSPKGHPATRI